MSDEKLLYHEVLELLSKANPKALEIFQPILRVFCVHPFSSELAKRGNNFLIIVHDQRDGSRWEIKPIRKAH